MGKTVPLRQALGIAMAPKVWPTKTTSAAETREKRAGTPTIRLEVLSQRITTARTLKAVQDKG